MAHFSADFQVISKKKSLHRNWKVFNEIEKVLSIQIQVISKKKGLHRNWNGFSVQIQVISKKKRSSMFHFDGPYAANWGL